MLYIYISRARLVVRLDEYFDVISGHFQAFHLPSLLPPTTLPQHQFLDAGGVVIREAETFAAGPAAKIAIPAPAQPHAKVADSLIAERNRNTTAIGNATQCDPAQPTNVTTTDTAMLDITEAAQPASGSRVSNKDLDLDSVMQVLLPCKCGVAHHLAYPNGGVQFGTTGLLHHWGFCTTAADVASAAAAAAIAAVASQAAASTSAAAAEASGSSSRCNGSQPDQDPFSGTEALHQDPSHMGAISQHGQQAEQLQRGAAPCLDLTQQDPHPPVNRLDPGDVPTGMICPVCLSEIQGQAKVGDIEIQQQAESTGTLLDLVVATVKGIFIENSSDCVFRFGLQDPLGHKHAVFSGYGEGQELERQVAGAVPPFHPTIPCQR